MPVVSALYGPEGMLALLCAFRNSAQTFCLHAMPAIGVEGATGAYVVFQIETTAVALTREETRSLAAVLIEQSQTGDLQRFGALLLEALASMPGARPELH